MGSAKLKWRIKVDSWKHYKKNEILSHGIMRGQQAPFYYPGIFQNLSPVSVFLLFILFLFVTDISVFQIIVLDVRTGISFGL